MDKNFEEVIAKEVSNRSKKGANISLNRIPGGDWRLLTKDFINGHKATTSREHEDAHVILEKKLLSKFEINRTSSFSVIDLNAILTLQLSPHAGQSDQHGGWAAESKSRWQ